MVLTSKVFDRFFSRFDKREFFLGTVFPDIRKFGLVEREATHFLGATINQVLEAKTSFAAGVIFHNLVDELFYDNLILIPGMKGDGNKIGVVKLLADELLYKKVENWREIANYFQDTITEELNFNMEQVTILKWHKILAQLFIEHPNNKNHLEFMMSINFILEKAKARIIFLDQIRESGEFGKFILDFYDNFENKLKLCSI
jgi:hypothetical protein